MQISLDFLSIFSSSPDSPGKGVWITLLKRLARVTGRKGVMKLALGAGFEENILRMDLSSTQMEKCKVHNTERNEKDCYAVEGGGRL